MKDTRIADRGLVLLGCGKMGSAMLAGWLDRGMPPDRVWVIEPVPSLWLRGTGVHINDDLPDAPAVVLVAVKPQMMGDALPAITALGGGETVFVSIAAGTSLASFEATFGATTPIVRAMPNTPAAIGRGITAICANAAGQGALDEAAELLSAVGEVVRLDSEAQIDAVTGVSGAGKSTLVNDILYPALARQFHNSTRRVGAHDRITGLDQLDKVVAIDQRPIGRTPRSNPVTYIKVFDEIRKFFSQLPGSRMRGYKPGRFSFNVKGGRCEACQGDGVRKIEMHFLSDVYVKCEECDGRRFNDATLEVKYKGASIADVLELTVAEAVEHFSEHPKIVNQLQLLMDVGLDYLHLGQPSSTLSGGEAQRIKLARELSKLATGKTFYILDEPTTGLHFDDVRKLLVVLNRLVDAGNSVTVIEHNLDVIKTADWIIDLGPDGGPGGGDIVAEGTPEFVSGVKGSDTGRYLAPLLGKQHKRKAG